MGLAGAIVDYLLLVLDWGKEGGSAGFMLVLPSSSLPICRGPSGRRWLYAVAAAALWSPASPFLAPGFSSSWIPVFSWLQPLLDPLVLFLLLLVADGACGW